MHAPNLNDLYHEEESVNDSDSNEESDEQNIKWKISYEEEIKLIKKLLSEGYFYNPDICPNCKAGQYRIK